MGQTVTVKSAPAGTRSVIAGGRRFVVGEPVRDVPDDVVKALKAARGVSVHVAAGKREPAAPAPTPADEE